MSGSVALFDHPQASGTGIRVLELQNPGKRNAVSLAMWRAITRHLETLQADPALRCVIVRGAGESFAAGGDIEEFLTERETAGRALAYHRDSVMPALVALAAVPVPVIAEIRGACVGGGLEIACCCDLRIAEPGARFGAPINKLGFSMYAGEMAAVLRAVPSAVLAEILFEGRLLPAQEAFAKGMLTRVVDAEALSDDCLAAATRIAAGAPRVARAHKHWLRRLGSGASPSEAECAESLSSIDSDDYREGLAAFMQKRAPRFTGR